MKKNFQFLDSTSSPSRGIRGTIFNFQKGYSLIEILLAIAIMGILTTFVALSFGKVNETEALDKNADSVISVLNEARSLTLSSVNDSRYGVHFEANQIVLFQGANYVAGAASNVPTSLNALVTLQNIALNGGGSNVVFNKLTGATSQYGSVQVALKSATTTYRTVSVRSTGVAEIN